MSSTPHAVLHRVPQYPIYMVVVRPLSVVWGESRPLPHSLLRDICSQLRQPINLANNESEAMEKGEDTGSGMFGEGSSLGHREDRER